METDVNVTVQDIQSIESASPAFRMWLADMYSRHFLDDIIHILVPRIGAADDKKGALEFLSDISRDSLNPHITIGDFHGDGYFQTRLFKELKQRTSGLNGDIRNDNTFMVHGIVGHAAMGELSIGALPPTVLQRHAHRQIEFWQNRHFQESFEFERWLIPHPTLIRNGKVTKEFEKQLVSIWDTLKSVPVTPISQAYNWLARTESERRRLRSLIAQFFGSAYVYQLEEYDSAGYLTAMTLMSWAGAILDYLDKGHRPLILETNVIGRNHGYNAGRIDAFEVSELDERPLRPSELKIMGEIVSKRARFESLENFVRSVSRLFNVKRVTLSVFDFKMAIGDGGPNHVLTESGIKDVSVRHTRQVQRYLCHLSLVHQRNSDTTPNGQISPLLWDSGGYGEIWYVLHSTLPKRIPIQLNSAELENAYIKEIAARWQKAQGLADVRQMSNRIYNRLFYLIDSTLPRKSFKAGTKSSLFQISETQTHIRKIVDAYRFKGPLDMFELIGIKNDKPEYGLHLDRLLEAIRRGLVKTRMFHPFRGGKIACPFHGEEGPSLHVYLADGHYHCFACEQRGNIIPGSVPDNMADIVSNSASGGDNKWDGNVSREHSLLMTRVQQFLSSSFWKSPVPAYLKDQRKIDPDLAFSLEIGYGSDELIIHLLECGYNIAVLERYGVISFSTRGSSSYRLPQMLKRYGLNVAERQRTVPDPDSGKDAVAHPYTMLRGRLTAPLYTGQEITNFYGRDLLRRSHIKLSTGVPYEGYHVWVASYPGDEVLVAEGVIEVLTLIHMGYSNSIAIVGVNNPIADKLLIASGKKIGLGFNIDSNLTGQTNTEKWRQRLSVGGIPPEKIRNFTNEFAMAHKGKFPNDFNDWWRQYGNWQELFENISRQKSLVA